MGEREPSAELQSDEEKTKLHEEKLKELDKKYFDKKFETSADEIRAYQDYEIEKDELDES